jgi:transcriptional regulator with XRE-family HTH domain
MKRPILIDWTQLRDRRIARGLTIQDVVAATGFLAPSIYSWERGATKPSGDALVRLAALYGFDPRTLLVDAT